MSEPFVAREVPRRPVVLVVEDDPMTREVVASYLAQSGFCALSAADGGEAMAHVRLRTVALDCLFTDIRLPGPISGLDVADTFQLLCPFKPIVYATGSKVVDERLLPDSIVLKKPYRPAEVVEALRRLERQTRAWTRKA